MNAPDDFMAIHPSRAVFLKGFLGNHNLTQFDPSDLRSYGEEFVNEIYDKSSREE
jgi:hypothetical protein